MTSIKSILRTPGRRRETFLRRSLALSLVILALALAVFPRTESTTEVLRYATAVEAGTAVNRTHFTTAHVPQHLIPENALRPDDLLASAPNERITISAHTAGSIATAVDFLDSSHTLSSVGNQLPFGEDQPINIVPIRLAEQSVSRVVQPGDVVDVIAANDAHDPHVVAAGGVIVFRPCAREKYLKLWFGRCSYRAAGRSSTNRRFPISRYSAHSCHRWSTSAST